MSRFLVLLGVWWFAMSARAEKIVFATYDDIPPKVYREGTELKGTYIEIIREICKRMNVEPVFETYPWPRAEVMTETGKVDALFPPFMTDERKKVYYFTEEPVTYTRNMAFALKKRKVKVTGLEDFKKLTVGVNDRYSYGPVFDAFKKKLRLDHSTTQEMLVKKLSASDVKRVDVVIASEEAFWFLVKRMGYKDVFEQVYVVSENPSYVVFSKAAGKSHQQMAERFNKTLVQFKKEGGVKRINDKYLK
ncbi:substrate-binding periplasmic protein [Bdellovibrio bacteriovorus]|uniref:Putative amino acid ABC transporter n=1 Tax=Bdellovibrio bacteriovorus str. Tiberius TaxID=1069642 RepID=K7Z998_BDEBC|nr:transporter substrate-binding domain-containing protein [Bdellovibrio bacteriovorus]AFY01109.1 putative amino acid ABC transporter [Bdellovibrio bacteriovorus str. Tiberius]